MRAKNRSQDGETSDFERKGKIDENTSMDSNKEAIVSVVFMSLAAQNFFF